MACGATFYVTPEGEYPAEGAMLPFRGIWDRLAPQAATIYLAAISYDPFCGRRLSQLYRIVRLNQRDRVIAELQAARPVTTSALLAEWFTLHEAPFTEQQAAAAIRERLRTLPRGLFVDPELAQDPSRLVVQAIRHLRDVGIVRAVNGTLMLGPHRRHPDFPHTQDIIAYQARFFSETLQGAGIICAALPASEPVRPKASGLPA